MILTFLTFNLLLKIKFKKDNRVRSNVLKLLSNTCLGAYLISCIFDNIYYDRLKILVPVMQDRFIYAPIMVILVLISSLFVSIIINLFYNMIALIIGKVKKYNNCKIEVCAKENQ